jgi:hypothetical protein
VASQYHAGMEETSSRLFCYEATGTASEITLARTGQSRLKPPIRAPAKAPQTALPSPACPRNDCSRRHKH